MPNCFELVPTGTTSPQRLQEIDDVIRTAFGVAPDPDHWYANWYNVIGLGIACGRELDYFTTQNGFSEEIQRVASFLRTHYTAHAWCERC